MKNAPTTARPFCALVYARGALQPLPAAPSATTSAPAAVNVRRTSAGVVLHCTATLAVCASTWTKSGPMRRKNIQAFAKNRIKITFTLFQLHAPDRSQSAIFLDFRPKTLRHEARASATMRTTGAATQKRTIVSTMICVFDSCGNKDCSVETAFRAALLTLLLSHSPP